jgi:hypothetical protein
VGNDKIEKVCKTAKLDVKKRIVYSEVYAPYTLDTYNDMMIPEDIEKMAHEYLRRADLNQTVDVNHDNVPISAYPVESFIARKGDPDFTEGAWVVGIKIVDELIWKKIESGELGGYSMEIMAKAVPHVATVYIASSSIGRTAENDDHSHYFFVKFDDNGNVIGGETSMDAGHVHKINYGTITETNYGHKHRFSLDS